MIDAKNVSELLTETTELNQSQIKTLTEIIIEYDDPEQLVYEAIGQLGEGISFLQVKKDFKASKFGWKGVPFKEYREERNLRDQIIANPPEVREGDIECPKCGLTKTIVIEEQTRSADEGFTYKVHCFNPKCLAVT